MGVVLIGLGGPSSVEDIEAYVYRLIMDPMRVRLRWVPGWIRERAARLLARRRAPALAPALQAVGGVAPEIRLQNEQARSLETELNRGADAQDASFRTYVAFRYGDDSVTETIEQMRRDGVSAVVLVPACPARLTAITDSCVAWWHLNAREVEFDHVPTVAMWAHDQDEAFIQAASDRLEEALQRFPRMLRDDVHLIFALHPGAALDAADGSPQQTPLAGIVSRICAHRSERRTRHLAYVQNWGLSRQPAPILVEALEAVADAGGTGVVVVPVGFTTDTMETAYELDVALRTMAEAHELRQVEVASGLNCNALYLRALADAVRGRVQLPAGHGDGTLLPVPVPTEVTARRGVR